MNHCLLALWILGTSTLLPSISSPWYDVSDKCQVWFLHSFNSKPLTFKKSNDRLKSTQCTLSSVQFSHSVVSYSLWPHGLQHSSKDLLSIYYVPCGLAWRFIAKEPACQCRRRGFSPWVEKIPWKRNWQPTSVSLHRKSYGQREETGRATGGLKESDVTWRLCMHRHTCA